MQVTKQAIPLLKHIFQIQSGNRDPFSVMYKLTIVNDETVEQS